MKKVLLYFLVLSSYVFAAKEDILGKWISPKYKDGNQIIIEVYEKEDGKFYAKMINQTVPKYLDGEFAGQDKMDLKNPDKSLRKRSLIGLELLTEMKYLENEDRYTGGQVYIPGMGKTLYAHIEIEKDQMNMKGSFDKTGIFGKTQVWERP